MYLGDPGIPTHGKVQIPQAGRGGLQISNPGTLVFTKQNHNIWLLSCWGARAPSWGGWGDGAGAWGAGGLGLMLYMLSNATQYTYMTYMLYLFIFYICSICTIRYKCSLCCICEKGSAHKGGSPNELRKSEAN